MNLSVRVQTLLLIVVAVALGSVLDALVFSTAVAGTFALLLVGAFGVWWGPRSPAKRTFPGGFVLLFGAGFGIYSAVKALPQYSPGVVVVAGILVGIVALVVFAVVRHVVLTAIRRRRLRDLAARRSWAYQRTANVDIRGRRTAERVAGVPTGGGPARAEDVLSGQIDGADITICDVRHNLDTQTVWRMRLPISVPYVSEGFVHYLIGTETGRGVRGSMADAFFGHAGSAQGTPPPSDVFGFSPSADSPTDHTDDPEFARAIVTPRVREMTTAGELPGWWMEGDQLLRTIKWRDIDTGDAERCAARADALAALRAAIPWDALPQRR
ncbi:hypothetical protein AB0J86_20890 [Micromonospora sp. NPDC049559]|uniref:hypothetical protein n=1 Tax=Micromonospora sp. NPDC049559 TaxID=3155923 RepID=UPI003417EF4D